MDRLPAHIANRFPDDPFGGQRPREVTSALHTMVGVAIVNLLAGLRREIGIA